MSSSRLKRSRESLATTVKVLADGAQICFTYMVQFLDKLSLNYASAYTLIPDLALEGQRYSWVAAIFNLCVNVLEKTSPSPASLR